MIGSIRTSSSLIIFALLAVTSLYSVSAFLSPSHHQPTSGFMSTKAWMKGLMNQAREARDRDLISRLAATRGGVAGKVKEVTTLEETEEALESAGDKLVVLDFTATWCGPCKMIASAFEALSEEMTEAVFLKVDVDVNADTAKRFDVYQMPTFCFVKNGEVQGRLVGANPDKLREAIQRFL